MPPRRKKAEPSRNAPTDPRHQRGFCMKFFPLCDGGPPPPPDAVETVARRQIEFLTAYYNLNVLYSKLETVRRKNGDAGRLMKKITEALRVRDQLEDRYAPEGFFGEPEMEGVYFHNIRFSHARASTQTPAVESSFSLFIPLVLPKGLTLRKYIKRELGLSGGRCPPTKRASSGRR